MFRILVRQNNDTIFVFSSALPKTPIYEDGDNFKGKDTVLRNDTILVSWQESNVYFFYMDFVSSRDATPQGWSSLTPSVEQPTKPARELSSDSHVPKCLLIIQVYILHLQSHNIIKQNSTCLKWHIDYTKYINDTKINNTIYSLFYMLVYTLY